MKTILSLCFIVSSFIANSQQIQWNEVETLSHVGINASSPLVGIDIKGNVTAVWLEQGDLLSKTKLEGDWSAYERLSTSGMASEVSLVVDKNGNAVVMWVDNDSIKACSRMTNGVWELPVTLSNKTSSPCLGMDNQGNVVAVWVRNNGNTTVIEAATKLVGQPWLTINTLSVSEGAGSPHVAIGSGGHVYAIWHALLNQNYAIFGAQQKLSVGKWSFEQVVSSSNLNCIQPRVAVNSTGLISAIWYQYISSDLTEGKANNISSLNVIGALKHFAENWAYPVELSYFNESSWGTGQPSMLKAHTVIDDQIISGIWPISFDGNVYHIQCLEIDLRTNQKIFREVAASLFSFGCDFSMDSEGNCLVTYMSYDEITGKTDVYSTETDGHAAFLNYWSIPVKLSRTGQNSFPKLAVHYEVSSDSAMADQRLASIVWVNYDGEFTSVQCITGTTKPLLPPTDVQVFQSYMNFGTFGDYMNTLSWNKSKSDNIVGYAIYRNDLHLFTVPKSVTSIQDHNQIKSTLGRTKYGIAAIDSQYDQSTIAEITFP